MLRERENNFFSPLPTELIREISGWANSDVAQALQYAAYARKEDVTALIEMLEENPSLLVQAADVKTPGGDEIRNVTIYEFVLGAGDYELAEMVQPYFSKIKDGEQQMIRQYERYRPHIEDMLKQEPYKLTPLIELIKKASAEDVKALLNKDMTRKSDLCEAIIQFRKDWSPRILTKPCMHYNYASLQHAFELLNREWGNLYETGGNNYDKIRLVWRQLIGFEMRRLPGIDRCVMAQGLYYVIEKQEGVARSYKFKNSDGDFPIIASDDSIDGLGGDFSVGARAGWDGGGGTRALGAEVGKLMSNKNFKLAKLMRPQPVYQPTGCVIL
ncbi:hypothetical protein [Legionella sp.]|uniref:hypothetical protein n=1 Tax=Legionella sp. TaxID=459 RepID=UPI003D0C7583